MKAQKNFLVIVTEAFTDTVYGPFTKDVAFLKGLRLASHGAEVSVFPTARPELFK